MKTTLPLLALALIFTGCATATPRSREAAVVQVWEAKWLAGCAQLKQVEGSSFFKNFIAEDLGELNAKTEALQKAADLGATHVVWDEDSKGIFGSHVSGMAYRCTPSS